MPEEKKVKLTRRDFLRGAALTATALALPGCFGRSDGSGVPQVQAEELPSGQQTIDAAQANALDQPQEEQAQQFTPSEAQSDISVTSEEHTNFQYDMPQNHVLIRVKPDDTLSDISSAFNCDINSLVDLNGISDANILQVDQLLFVPVSEEGVDEENRDWLISQKDLEKSQELIFVATSRSDLPPGETDFSPEELREINGFLRNEGPKLLAELYGFPMKRGVVRVMHTTKKEEVSFIGSFKTRCGGFVIPPQEGKIPIFLLPLEGCDSKAGGPSIPAKWQDILIEEMAHIWLEGLDLPDFDEHNIAHIAPFELSRRRGDNPAYILGPEAVNSQEYRLFLQNPLFFRNLLSQS